MYHYAFGINRYLVGVNIYQLENRSKGWKPSERIPSDYYPAHFVSVG
jgi:hypothetical protein